MRNLLLDALPSELYESLASRFERVSIKRGTVLHEPGSTIRHLYFPLSCLVSITITTPEGRTAETGVAGNREMVGVNAFMGGSETTQTRYVVQIPGDAMKIASQPLLEAFDANKAVRDVLLRYTQAMIAQISQNAACNRLHDLTQRYARWLLELRDRVHTQDLSLTREFAALMLGVRRATVSDISTHFEETGLITVQRGLTHITDSAGLERASCECYRVLRDEHDRLLGRPDSKAASSSRLSGVS
ncbi:MAG: Crp/Fnr family transcriptional regulator [Burkholderiales bacterium]